MTEHDAELDLIAKLLLENRKVPAVHRCEPEFFLELRVDVVRAEIVVGDLNDWLIRRRVNHSLNLGTILLEFSHLVNGLRKTGQYKLALVLPAAIYYFLKHADDHVRGNGLTLYIHLMHLKTNRCLPHNLALDQFGNVQVHEVVVTAKLLRDFFAEGFALGAWTDMDDAGLEPRINLLHGLIEITLSVDLSKVGTLLEIRQQTLRSITKSLYIFRKLNRGNIISILFIQGVDPSLTNINRARQIEYIRWRRAVSQEEFGLELILWEVLEDHASLLLLRKCLNQLQTNCLVVLVLQLLFHDPFGEVNVLHGGALDHVFGDGRLSRGLLAKKEHGLGKHGGLGRGGHGSNVSCCIDTADFAKFLIVLHDWVGRIEERLHSLFEYLRGVISTPTRLRPLKAPFEHKLLRSIKVQNLLGFEYVLLEVQSLIQSPWKAIDEIFLLKDKER